MLVCETWVNAALPEIGKADDIITAATCSVQSNRRQDKFESADLAGRQLSCIASVAALVVANSCRHCHSSSDHSSSARVLRSRVCCSCNA
jgi:hypothetical protein